MTAHGVSNEPRSRRALLGGLLGGVGVWAASMVSQATPASAAAGDPIRMGRLNKASGTSTELQTSSSKPTFWARQLGGGHAIRAEATNGRAVMATAGSDGTAVWAYSPDHFGISVECPGGIALDAAGATAASFNGNMLLVGHQDIYPSADLIAPMAPLARLFVRDGGGGKLELCVRFQTGAVQVIATQP